MNPACNFITSLWWMLDYSFFQVGLQTSLYFSRQEVRRGDKWQHRACVWINTESPSAPWKEVEDVGWAGKSDSHGWRWGQHLSFLSCTCQGFSLFLNSPHEYNMRVFVWSNESRARRFRRKTYSRCVLQFLTQVTCILSSNLFLARSPHHIEYPPPSSGQERLVQASWWISYSKAKTSIICLLFHWMQWIQGSKAWLWSRAANLGSFKQFKPSLFPGAVWCLLQTWAESQAGRVPIAQGGSGVQPPRALCSSLEMTFLACLKLGFHSRWAASWSIRRCSLMGDRSSKQEEWLGQILCPVCSSPHPHLSFLSAVIQFTNLQQQVLSGIQGIPRAQKHGNT